MQLCVRANEKVEVKVSEEVPTESLLFFGRTKKRKSL